MTICRETKRGQQKKHRRESKGTRCPSTVKSILYLEGSLEETLRIYGLKQEGGELFKGGFSKLFQVQ